MSKGTVLTVEAASLPVGSGSAYLQAQRPSFRRRFVAAWSYDYLVAMWIATILLAFTRVVIGANPPLPVPFLFFVFSIFLFRDCLPGGLSAGKNLFGLEVVDKESGRAVTAWQSVRRNLLLLAPYFLYYLVALFPAQSQNSNILLSAIKTFGTIYIALLLLVEGGLMIFCGERLADKLAGTKVKWRTGDEQAWVNRAGR
jgi:hypothetical protein